MNLDRCGALVSDVLTGLVEMSARPSVSSMTTNARADFEETPAMLEVPKPLIARENTGR